MSYKTILVHSDPGERCALRLDAAINLARQFDAHLVALYAQAPFVLPGYLLPQVGPEIIAAQQSAVAAAMARAEAAFSQRTATVGLKNVEWRTAIDNPVEVMAMHARYADLVVIGQGDAGDNSGVAADFPVRLTLTAGRPVLILPNAGRFASVGKRVLIAWDASREATRAVTDALPLLRLADTVNIVAINPVLDGHGRVPGADISVYLARHGVRAELHIDQGVDIDVGNELLSRAADFSADLIVMGCYGHSRLREWVLGGATRTILDTMTTPVLMAH